MLVRRDCAAELMRGILLTAMCRGQQEMASLIPRSIQVISGTIGTAQPRPATRR